MSLHYCHANHNYQWLIFDPSDKIIFNCNTCLSNKSHAIQISHFLNQIQNNFQKIHLFYQLRFVQLQNIIANFQQNLDSLLGPLFSDQSNIIQILQLQSHHQLIKSDYQQLNDYHKFIQIEDFHSKIDSAIQNTTSFIQSITKFQFKTYNPQISQNNNIPQPKINLQQYKPSQYNTSLLSNIDGITSFQNNTTTHVYSCTLLKKETLLGIAYGKKHPLVIYDPQSNITQQFYYQDGVYDLVEIDSKQVVACFSNKLGILNSGYTLIKLIPLQTQGTRIIYSKLRNCIVTTDILTELGNGNHFYCQWNLLDNSVRKIKHEGRACGGITFISNDNQVLASEIVQKSKKYVYQLNLWNINSGDMRLIKCKEKITGVFESNSHNIFGFGKEQFYIWNHKFEQINVIRWEWGELDSLSIQNLNNKVVIGDHQGSMLYLKQKLCRINIV